MTSTPERTAGATYLGVDGGGTKTAFVLVDDAGAVLASALAPSCYYLGQGIGLVEEVLRDGIRRCARRPASNRPTSGTPSSRCPGYGEVSADLDELDAIPGRVLGHSRYACDNDMVAGWAGSLGARRRRQRHRRHRVDDLRRARRPRPAGRRVGRAVRRRGVGVLDRDPGLSAFARMSDGRLPVGPLHGHLTRHLELAADLDLVDVVLNRWQGDRARIASLARIVTTAAGDGDEVCRDMLRRGRAGRWPAWSRPPSPSWATRTATSSRCRGPAACSPARTVSTAFRQDLADASVELRDPTPSAGTRRRGVRGAAGRTALSTPGRSTGSPPKHRPFLQEAVMSDTSAPRHRPPAAEAAGFPSPDCWCCSGASGARSPARRRRSTAIPTRWSTSCGRSRC